MVQFCKFLNVRIIDPSNPVINFIVFHHRYETLEEGCTRIADMYRYNNSSRTKFLIEYEGKIQLDVEGCQILI